MSSYSKSTELSNELSAGSTHTQQQSNFTYRLLRGKPVRANLPKLYLLNQSALMIEPADPFLIVHKGYG